MTQLFWNFSIILILGKKVNFQLRINGPFTGPTWKEYYRYALHLPVETFKFQVYRHGDRSPTHRYPLDPVKESDWPQGYGQLSKVCELNSKYLCKKWVLADLNKIFFFFSFSILTDIKNLFFIPFDNYLNSVYSVIFQPMFFFFLSSQTMLCSKRNNLRQLIFPSLK